MREAQLDGVLAHSFQAADIETARSLFDTKWWDYRFIHPGYCLFLYAHHLSEVTTRWRSMFGIPPFVELRANQHPLWHADDEVRGKTKIVTNRVRLSPPGYRTSLWRGMCFADSYGVPYDRWINFGFEFAFESQWERMPSASNLYGAGMATYIIERWRAEKADLLRLPADPRYLNENYVGHPWQDSQREWLVNLIKARSMPHLALAQYMCREARVPEDMALKYLGSDTVARAKASAYHS